jgi:hypothetical protein
MEIPENISKTMRIVLSEYDFSKREQRTIALFIQTLIEYKETPVTAQSLGIEEGKK